MNAGNASKVVGSESIVNRRPRVLVGATGCVAALQVEILCRSLAAWADVVVVFTKNSLRFINTQNLPANVQAVGDDNDWSNWQRLGDKVLHIELCEWADVMLIAPLSANTLAKIAGGLCDNLLTCIVRAWDCEKKVIYIAPAMNAQMWNNPFTEKHIVALDDMQIRLIRPQSQRMPNGGFVTGAMAPTVDICNTIKWHFMTGLPGHVSNPSK